ncbi:hypothetical protein B0T11DRAFT_271467 [Plectosphaerella cucumerina]|uniref:Uncharacterized protein n=1 Tax=Plectosphaerella cucumerina TaxID=40658 RepID=A0A8K0XAA4_9PEZI|nr:hypothetical protein B0T11DRAFT_271467 [Plectosphaerella cucumerina]
MRPQQTRQPLRNQSHQPHPLTSSSLNSKTGHSHPPTRRPKRPQSRNRSHPNLLLSRKRRRRNLLARRGRRTRRRRRALPTSLMSPRLPRAPLNPTLRSPQSNPRISWKTRHRRQTIRLLRHQDQKRRRTRNFLPPARLSLHRLLNPRQKTQPAWNSLRRQLLMSLASSKHPKKARRTRRSARVLPSTASTMLLRKRPQSRP